jgi:hypothetical protein
VRANQSSIGLSESFESSIKFVQLAESLGAQTKVSPIIYYFDELDLAIYLTFIMI